MKKYWVHPLIILTMITHLYALDSNTRKKFSKLILTDDYNILNKTDLQLYYTANYEYVVDNNSWQCFPRNKISIAYDELNYEPDYNEKFGSLKITVNLKNICHKYEYKRALPVSDCKDFMNKWLALMKDEKYVCFGGNFVSREEQIRKGQHKQVYDWVLDRIKTKKGSDS